MEERERALRTDFSIGAYVGFLFAEAAEKHKLILVTDMAPDNFTRTHIKAVRTLDEALEAARTLNGGTLDMKTILMPPRRVYPAQGGELKSAWRISFRPVCIFRHNRAG